MTSNKNNNKKEHVSIAKFLVHHKINPFLVLVLIKLNYTTYLKYSFITKPTNKPFKTSILSLSVD